MKDFNKCILPCELLKIGDIIEYENGKQAKIIDIRKIKKTSVQVFKQIETKNYIEIDSVIYPNNLKITILRKF